MRKTRLVALSFLLTLTSIHAARAADAPSATEGKNEIVVFGGISLLDASRSGQDQIFPLDRTTQIASRFGFGRNPFPLPIPLPPVSFSTQSAIGSSALFGARYTRQIKDRLGLEADLTVAPRHEIETRGSGCIGDLCFGEGGSRDLEGRGRGFGRGVAFGGRNVNAWHYGAGLAYELMHGDVRPVADPRRGRCDLGRRARGRDRLRVPLRGRPQDPVRARRRPRRRRRPPGARPVPHEGHRARRPRDGGAARALLGVSSLADDQPGAAVVGHVRPGPVEHHHEAGCGSRSGRRCGCRARRARRRARELQPADHRPTAAPRGRSSRASPCRGSGTAAAARRAALRAHVRRGVIAHLHRRRGDARHRRAVLLERREVADHEDLAGDPATVRSGCTRTRPARSSGAPSERAERRGRDARRPRARSARRSARRRRDTPSASTPRHREPVRTSTPSASSCAVRLADRSSGYAGRTRGPAFEQDDARARPDRCAGSRAPACGARSRRARRPARRPVGPPPTTTNVSQRPARLGVRLALGLLEGEQHPPADLERVLDASSGPARSGCPLVVAEVGVRGAGRQDQVVVGELAVGRGDLLRARGRRPSTSAEQHVALRAAGAGCGGSARRCRRARAPPSPPGRAAAGRGGGSCGRRA